LDNNNVTNKQTDYSYTQRSVVVQLLTKIKQQIKLHSLQTKHSNNWI